MTILLADNELQESRPFALEGTELASKLECKSRDLEDLGSAQSLLGRRSYSSFWEPVAGKSSQWETTPTSAMCPSKGEVCFLPFVSCLVLRTFVLGN